MLACCDGVVFAVKQLRLNFKGKELHGLSQESATPAVGLPTVSLTFGPQISLHILSQQSHRDRAGSAEHESGFAGTPFDAGFGRDSTGARPWWGGLILASWIAHQPLHHFQGKNIIELGCGSFAFPSAAASICGAATALATDGCESCINGARSLLMCNGSSLRSFSTRHLSWEDATAKPDDPTWDIVLFADVLYKEDAAPILAGMIASLLRPGGVVLGAVGLHRTGSSKIFSEMRSRNFVAQEMPILEPMLSTAFQASACLDRASRFDIVGSSESTSFANNENKIIQWVMSSGAGDLCRDMSESLRDQVLHAPRAYEAEARAQTGSDWIPYE
jgi:predicted nicotinamide N-methyase